MTYEQLTAALVMILLAIGLYLVMQDDDDNSRGGFA